MAFFTSSNFKKAAVFIAFLASSANALDAVNLGTAADFVILTKSGISTTGVTSVLGDVGTSPIYSGSLMGFGMTMDSSNTFSKSDFVDGNVYAADYANPTPSKLTTAIFDMETAYTDAASRTNPDFVEMGDGNIDGATLTPGLYKWGTCVSFSSDLTFDGLGNPNDVWILQISGDVDVGTDAIVNLTNGAQAKNIFWQIAGSTKIGARADVQGVFLCMTAIVFEPGSSLNGAALAQADVTLFPNTTIVQES